MNVCADMPAERFDGGLKIAGTVTRDGSPSRCYVRLLDRHGDFLAELPTGADGGFTFFVIPGDWTLRLISAEGTKDLAITLVDTDATDLSITI